MTPSQISEITPLWLTDVLRSADLLRGQTKVQAFEAAPASDVGYVADLQRLTLTYTPPDPALPRTLIAKFTSDEPDPLIATPISGENEARFYRTIAPYVRCLRVPTCYYAKLNPNTHVGLILLEDCGDMRVPSLVKGVTRAQAESIVQRFACFHARWRKDASPRAIEWLPRVRGYSRLPLEGWWARYLPEVVRLLPNFHLPKWFPKLGTRFVRSPATVFEPLSTGNITLIHRDAHAENFLFEASGAAFDFVTLDWELVAQGKGVMDIAYFLLSSVTVADRRAWERDLLYSYHQTLCAGGVQGYDFAACWLDYRRAVFDKFVVTMFATILYDNATPHRRAWRAADLRRILAFMDDHAVGELFA